MAQQLLVFTERDQDVLFIIRSGQLEHGIVREMNLALAFNHGLQVLSRSPSGDALLSGLHLEEGVVGALARIAHGDRDKGVFLARR